MKILITGALGFLGRHLVQRLNFKHELLTPNSKELDVLNCHSLEKYFEANDFSVVIHLAARCGGIGANRKNPAVFFEKNLQMSSNMLKFASEFDQVKKMMRTKRSRNLGT